MKKLIGIDFNELSWSRYVENLRKVKEFVASINNKSDIQLKSLDLKFINDFELHLKVERKLSQATINRSIQRIRKVIRFAIVRGYLKTDPFILYKPKKVKNRVIFLSEEELNKLKSFQFHQSRLQQVKDWFIFSCYTGLAYNEIKNLKTEHLEIGFDGELWIEMIREKTQKEISIPILPQAKSILDKYMHENSDKIFDVCSNQKYNSYLKEIGEIVGIKKKLTTHTARKTFASTVLLYNDVPMEIVSELLGHSSITITEGSYGKVIKKKVSDEIRRLKNR